MTVSCLRCFIDDTLKFGTASSLAVGTKAFPELQMLGHVFPCNECLHEWRMPSVLRMARQVKMAPFQGHNRPGCNYLIRSIFILNSVSKVVIADSQNVIAHDLWRFMHGTCLPQGAVNLQFEVIPERGLQIPLLAHSLDSGTRQSVRTSFGLTVPSLPVQGDRTGSRYVIRKISMRVQWKGPDAFGLSR